MHIPKTHPRYASLKIREKLVNGIRDGIVVMHGLIAHGRGEAFDYILGERTHPFAKRAEKIAAAYLILAKKPVISVNGNTALLVPKDIAKLSKLLENCRIEVNLFHRNKERVEKIIELLENYGCKDVLGRAQDAKITGLNHSRALCCKNGIYSADVVFIPLEDGDRAITLRNAGKKVIAVDLNPFSRTSRVANVTIVDNIIRALPYIIFYLKKMKMKNKAEVERLISEHDNKKNLEEAVRYIIKWLKHERNRETH
ncbi:MAG: 4-phosphopantoate--beta-alanine ligase [Candidatus Thermoplasmatota archaeon]